MTPDPLSVDCPHCMASVGFPCHKPRSATLRSKSVEPHASRRSLAVAVAARDDRYRPKRDARPR